MWHKRQYGSTSSGNGLAPVRHHSISLAIFVKKICTVVEFHTDWTSYAWTFLRQFNSNNNLSCDLQYAWSVFTHKSDYRFHICFHLLCISPIVCTWWRHQMEIFFALLVLCADTSEFPAQRSVPRGFDVFFDPRSNKRLSKQSWGWWFETLSRPLWRQCNDLVTVSFKPPPIYVQWASIEIRQ